MEEKCRGHRPCKTWTTFFWWRNYFLLGCNKIQGAETILKNQMETLSPAVSFFSLACFPWWTECFHGPYCWDYSHFFFSYSHYSYEIPTYLQIPSWVGGRSFLCRHPMLVTWCYLRVEETGKTKARPRDTLHIDTDLVPPQVSLFYPISENT